MSTPEKWVIPLALHHPLLFELKEGLIIMPEPSDHPMVGHPHARALSLPSTSGSILIAERLGVLAQHPKVKEHFTRPDGSAGERWLPFPWIQDPLLYLRDQYGPYCISWDIKKTPADHGKPGPGDFVERSDPRRVRQAAARDAVYCEYMRELGIPIKRIAQSSIDDALARNLLSLMIGHAQCPDLDPELHAEILSAYEEMLIRGDAPVVVIDSFTRRGLESRAVSRVLDHAIFERRIRINLYRSWAVDRPLEPETKDPLVEYASWFAR